MAALLEQFILFNRSLCNRIERRLPHTREILSVTYEERVGREMNMRGGLVIDVGGGKFCPFARYRNPEAGARIVAVDHSEREMEGNDGVDEKRLTDVTERLPFCAGEANIIASRYLIEHLTDQDAFIEEVGRVLSPGGLMIALLPSKYALFAMLNQLLPHRISERILMRLKPEARGIAGFETHYRGCYASAMRSILARHGFEIVELRLGYYQSRYFSFFVPLYLFSVIYELTVRAMGLENLAAYLMIVAKKSPPEEALLTAPGEDSLRL